MRRSKSTFSAAICFFFKDADIDSMWPGKTEVAKIAKFLRDNLKRPALRSGLRNAILQNEIAEEPACVLGYLQVFVLSNGDVLTGCYPLKPVGNVLRREPGNDIEFEGIRRSMRGDGATRVSRVYVRSGEFAGDEARGIQRIAPIGG